jgi:hypothetical protein
MREKEKLMKTKNGFRTAKKRHKPQHLELNEPGRKFDDVEDITRTIREFDRGIPDPGALLVEESLDERERRG